ncbi:hypothetical protein DFJ58DRAFT_913424 [Suillus subalutaceus]|uniref:uncharacterized protein n=1 Tax=Suillus subalutaceus TaxID=48586 RepID=UPI001B884FCA|nr:uncharacterized protein DFJ58DRAFT_913424 [Suillus subalutaceus]KAG1857700.1 hypothetical protein DFJ58DRAFT_913424 [Suillus subalutaceus]
MTMPYPLCVFIESREQGKLSAGHPFCHIVRETVQNVVLSHPILHHMARNTLENPDEAAEKQRVEEIIEYLKNTCPTISGSDSPATNSTFVDVRAYTGCGKDMKSRKIARKYIYIQKRLIDEWMKVSANKRIFLVLTIFMKLCLIRGLVAAVKLSFASEDVNVKDEAHGSPYYGWPRLEPLATADLTALDAELNCTPYNVFQPHCLRMWDSPIDPEARKIETK